MFTFIYGADMKRTTLVAGLPLYVALFKDIAAYDGELQPTLSADLLRIEKLTITRGLPFLMIDFPEAGKVVDFSLSRGVISWSALPPSFGTRNGHPKLLWGLFHRVFCEDGTLMPDVDPNHIYFLRQVLYLCKKVRKECSNAAILAEVNEFRKVDEALRNPTLSWDSDSLCGNPDHNNHYGCDCQFERIKPHSDLRLSDGYKRSPDLFSNRDECPERLLNIAQDVSDRICSRFPGFDWRDLRPRHGPGAVADARSGTDKYLFPTWPAKLERTFPSNFYGQSREDLHLEVDGQVSPMESPAKLMAVPKTLKGPRLIASEPIAHQFLQLGLMRWIRQNLPTPLRLSIDFLSQEPSRVSCLKASHTGDIASVDLSAASDRLSCWAVERIFRRSQGLLYALHATRTRALKNATGVGEAYYLKLRKFAAMGSGTTFPVQSICYTILSIASVIYEDNGDCSYQAILRAARKIRVFGDDILIPSHAVPSLALLLRHLQLKVNVLKTHYSGHFRESCGMDAYNGFNVSPLYLRDLELGQSADALVSWVDVSNNAYTQGLWHLSDAMLRTIPSKLMRLIPQSKLGIGCLSLRSNVPKSPQRVRYNTALQRDETQGLVIRGGAERRRRDSHQSILQFFIEEPSPDTNWQSGYDVRKRLVLTKRWVSLT